MPFITTALVAGGIAAAGAVGTSALKAHAAGEAAKAQMSAAERARQVELENQQKGIDFAKSEYATQREAEQPYLSLGQTSANAYSDLINNPFKAPTLEEAEQTPGYKFNLEQGTQAINEHAAATGNLMSGNTGVALTKFGQGLATTTYQQAYDNALNSWLTRLDAARGGVSTGLNATGQLGTFGQQTANNLSGLYLTGGQQQASQINNKGAAQASGYVGAANAWAPGIQSVANFASTVPNLIYPPSTPSLMPNPA